MADYLNDFREPGLVSKLAGKIREYNCTGCTIMEVCGTHTMSISRYGIRNILPNNVKLVSGPGCPVCVTPAGYIDAAVEISRMDSVIIATFGDLIRVPGSVSTLARERSSGRDIRVVLSPLDALKIASENRDKKVVFLSVGFETTVPSVALSIKKAQAAGIDNYSILTANKTMPNALRTLVKDRDTRINGFLYPGHVSAITGTCTYEELEREYGIPGAVAGFEPLDILYSIYRLLELYSAGKSGVINEYSRVVRREGNKEAVDMIYSVFEPCDSIWRGLGMIAGSGLKLKYGYSGFDTWKVFGIDFKEVREPEGCICGSVLKGSSLPRECPHFGKTCTPGNPIGSCMVSSEGTCSAYYKYGG